MAGSSGGGNARRTGASARRATKGRNTKAVGRGVGKRAASSKAAPRKALKPKVAAARFTAKKKAKGGKR